MDWPKLIANLNNAGWTQTRIAAHCETRQSTISDLFLGKSTEPLHSLGEKLKLLHIQATGQVFMGQVIETAKAS